jgi:hypothetical protein
VEDYWDFQRAGQIIYLRSINLVRQEDDREDDCEDDGEEDWKEREKGTIEEKRMYQTWMVPPLQGGEGLTA